MNAPWAAPQRDGYLTVDELAEQVGCTPAHVRRQLSSGRLLGEKQPVAGRQVWYIPANAARAYVAARVAASEASGELVRLPTAFESAPQGHVAELQRAQARITELEGEVARLKGKLVAMSKAHGLLVEVFSEDI